MMASETDGDAQLARVREACDRVKQARKKASSTLALDLYSAAGDLLGRVDALDCGLSSDTLDLPVEWRVATNPDTEIARPIIPFPEAQVHLRVDYLDGSTRYYPTSPDNGWRSDPITCSLVISRGLGRLHIPLAATASYSPEPCKPGEHS